MPWSKKGPCLSVCQKRQKCWQCRIFGSKVRVLKDPRRLFSIHHGTDMKLTGSSTFSRGSLSSPTHNPHVGAFWNTMHRWASNTRTCQHHITTPPWPSVWQVLCKGDPELVKYSLSWFARYICIQHQCFPAGPGLTLPPICSLIQFPERKIGTCLVFKGQQGVGKGIWLVRVAFRTQHHLARLHVSCAGFPRYANFSTPIPRI